MLCVLVGHNELTSDIPQFKSDKTGKDLDFYNWRSRGFLTLVEDRRVVLFSEEDVLEYEGGMQLESIKDAANDYYDDYWAPFWERLYEKHGLKP